jgi:hypothetical protein
MNIPFVVRNIGGEKWPFFGVLCMVLFVLGWIVSAYRERVSRIAPYQEG